MRLRNYLQLLTICKKKMFFYKIIREPCFFLCEMNSLIFMDTYIYGFFKIFVSHVFKATTT